MIWFRKLIVAFLSLILFFALLDGVLATSIDIAVSHPAKLEIWLNQSGLYSSFIDTAIKQANTGGNSGNQGVAISDPEVQQAIESAFSPNVIQKDITIFLNSNYAWLEGKTSIPTFTINLTPAKQAFASQVGQEVTSHLEGLPICTPAQTMAAAQTTDPLALNCRPVTLNPTEAGLQTAQQLDSAAGFLSNPIITQNTFSPQGNLVHEAYYKQFSIAPKVYQLATKIPLALAGLALICIIGIFLISPVKRRGLRRLMYVFLEVGLLLIAVKFVSDFAFKKIESKVFNQSNSGPLQHSLTTFAKLIETQLNSTDIDFGVVLIILAIGIIIWLAVTHHQNQKQIQSELNPEKMPANQAPQPTPVLQNSQNPIKSSTSAQPQNSNENRSPRPKKPRLIQ